MRGLYILFIVLTLVSCSEKEVSNLKKKDSVTKSVRVEKLIRKSAEKTILISSELKAVKQSGLKFNMGGKVISIRKKIGQKVRRGEVLALIDTSVTSANLMMAASNFEKMNYSYEHSKKLFKDSLISEEEFLQIKNGYYQAKGRHLLAKENYDNCILRAPFSGRVADYSLNIGELYSPSGPVSAFIIVDNSKILCRISLSDREAEQVNKNSRIFIKNTDIKGKLLNLPLAAVNRSRTFDIEVEFDNKDGLLKPGQIKEFVLKTGKKDNVLLIPVEVIKKLSGLQTVLIYENNIVKSKAIETGDIFKNRTEVLSGLSEGDLLIIEGYDYVREGDKVRVASEGVSDE